MFMKTMKYLFYTCIFVISIAVFIPKLNLYYFIENQLSKESIVLNNEKISQNLFTVNINEIDVYLYDKKYVKIEYLKSEIFGFKNSFQIEEFYFFNKNKKIIDRLIINHNIFIPTTLEIQLEKSSNKIRGKIDLLSRKILFSEQPFLKSFENTFREFKFSKINGAYFYEY